jgi:hypothetical protein
MYALILQECIVKEHADDAQPMYTALPPTPPASVGICTLIANCILEKRK